MVTLTCDLGIVFYKTIKGLENSTFPYSKVLRKKDSLDAYKYTNGLACFQTQGHMKKIYFTKQT